MTTDRIKEIQAETAYPYSLSVQQALLKVWNECQQEQDQVKKCSIPDVKLSCFQEVWQKWCESKSTQEFDGWLHAQMHEA